jgi:hypothetical protein
MKNQIVASGLILIKENKVQVAPNVKFLLEKRELI